jgi:peptidoglycan/xylan/chitin deacetylase (PgdA/CDA1 family)
VCHGLLHLVPEKMERGEVDWFEFRELDRDEAGRRLDKAIAWQESALGRRPPTFVAPAWGYSEGALAAAADHDLPAWLPPTPGPLLDGPNIRETLDPALRGIYKLDYSPLARWASAGMPPTLVFHGGMFDLRFALLRPAHDYVTLARLMLKRDILRVPGIEGVKWVGAGEYAELLREHHVR